MNNTEIIRKYLSDLNQLSDQVDWQKVEELTDILFQIWKDRKNVFVCGNGGSAANAEHMANDFIYGVTSGRKPAIRIRALPANPSVLTCLANDIDYESIFSHQLVTLADEGDLLIVLSGSGNSKNIVNAVDVANKMKMTTCGLLGYDGGEVAPKTDLNVLFPINDMQLSEDFQLITIHLLMRCLNQKVLGNI